MDDDERIRAEIEAYLDPLREHFTALGHLAYAWTQADLSLSLALTVYIGLKYPGDERNAIIGNIPFRNKIRMTAALGFIHRKDDAQYDELKEHLDKLDNECRVQRNRMMHDIWIPKPQAFQRWMRESKIKREKGSGTISLTTSEKVPVSPDEIHALAFKIISSAAFISVLAFESAAPIVQPPESP